MQFEEKYTEFRHVSIILKQIPTSFGTMLCTIFICNSEFYESMSCTALWARDSRCTGWHTTDSFRMYCHLGIFAPTIMPVFTTLLNKLIWLFVRCCVSLKLYGLNKSSHSPIFWFTPTFHLLLLTFFPPSSTLLTIFTDRRWPKYIRSINQTFF